MKIESFFAELKRRNVYKVAVAYAVVGWLLVQVATQVFPFLEIPNWVVRLVIALVVIGFPIALIIAWAFELRAKGDKSLWLADTLINVEARLGHREEVQREAEALIEQSRKDKWRYPRTEEVLARSYFALGDNDRAWPLLEHAVSAPADQSLTVANLRLDPIWDPIRNEPRFQKLIAEGTKP